MTGQNSTALQSEIFDPKSAIDGSLCQPDPSKSCGACCGLYNWQNHSRPVLIPLLERSTSLFFSLGRNPDQFRKAYADEAPPPNPKLLETIYNCEFLGFLDEKKKRVGCLLHPSVNDGRDLRDHCFYGKETCSAHYCPSYTQLTKAERASVRLSIDDWYLYGLVITDIDLVKVFFQQVETRLGDTLREEGLKDQKVRDALREFFVLKETWKFSSGQGRLGKYYFSHSEYQIARIEYGKRWQIQPSRFDKILLSLESEFQTPEDILVAESIIEGKIVNFLTAYEG
jgi:hypothetical protein